MSQKKPCQSFLNIILVHKEKNVLPIPSKLEQLIKDNGLVDSEMAKVYKSGLMEPAMKVNGKTIEHMVMESLSMLMVTYMRVIG